MDFSDFPEIANGQTISSIVGVVANPVSGLTIGATSIATPAKSVKVWISGGAHNSKVIITTTIKSSSFPQATLVLIAQMLISDDPIGGVS